MNETIIQILIKHFKELKLTKQQRKKLEPCAQEIYEVISEKIYNPDNIVFPT